MIVPIVFQEPTADDLSREEMYSMAEEMDQHLNTVSFSINYIHSMIWYDMIWYDMIWYDMIWHDMICMIWYDMIWDEMIWYDMDMDMILILIWYDMIWYDMTWCSVALYDRLRYKRNMIRFNIMYYYIKWNNEQTLNNLILHDL